MARATTRSQKTPRASQSQPRPSQSQRARRPRDSGGDQSDEDPSQRDEGEQMGVDEDEGGDVGGKVDVQPDIMRKANDLARLALFTERKRTALRREDINKKVLGSNARAFNYVFAQANLILQKTFGMELVELQSRAGLNTDRNNANNEDELEEARKAAGIKKKAATTGSKTYILRSILHPIIIEHAALTDEQILEEEALEFPSEDEDDDEPSSLRSYGSIISWSSADQLGSVGILYVILAVILVSGRVMSDMDLRSILKRLRLPPTAAVGFSAQSTHRNLPVEQYLNTLIRQGYLDRHQTGEPAKQGQGRGNKRGRMTQADDESAATYEWQWGARAQSEVGEKGIAQFVAEFMVGDAQEDGDEEEDGPSRARGVRRRDNMEAKLLRMMKGIERAAGGHLSNLR